MKKTDLIRLAMLSETLELDESARRSHKGSYIRLSDGVTRYQFSGTGKGLVILVHGFSSPYFIYDNLYDILIRDGYRVLRYDLIGRGLSDRPDAVYDADFFVKHLHELTEALVPGERFSLVGTSMGGIIVTRYAETYPESVERLVLLAPAVMDTFKAPAVMKLCTVPVIGPKIFCTAAPVAIITRSADELRLASEDEKFRYIKRFADFARYKGYMRALCSSLRDCILDYDTAMEAYRAVAASGIPMQVIWGTDDHTMPYYQIERMREVCPDAECVTYDGAYHMFVYDEAERTAGDIEPFLISDAECS